MNRRPNGHGASTAASSSETGLAKHARPGPARTVRDGGGGRRTPARCPFCSAPLKVHDDRCVRCAAELGHKCSACGHATPPHGQFCVHCGEPLLAGPASRLAPELRQLTVVFYDLVGSTALVNALGVEASARAIADFHREVTGVMGRFGGFLAHYRGDGALVLFGYPSADEDDAPAAVQAALAAVRAVAGMRLDDGRPLAIRIGAATGLAVVGDMVGEGDLRGLDVSGEAPNLAARLQGLAEQNAVLISDDLRQMVGPRIDAEDLGRRSIKGWTEPLRVWRVLGIAQQPDRFGARVATQRTPMVDRTAETASLLDAWHAACEGRGSAWLWDPLESTCRHASLSIL